MFFYKMFIDIHFIDIEEQVLLYISNSVGYRYTRVTSEKLYLQLLVCMTSPIHWLTETGVSKQYYLYHLSL